MTFAVNVGLLQITVPATAGTALTWKADEGGSIIEPLGDVTVTDNRALDAPTWAATVTSSDFTTTGASAAATIPAGDVGYWCGPLVASSDPADTTTVETVTTNNETLVPGQTVGTAAADSALLTSTTGTAAYSLTAGISVNSAEWDPTITVHVPDNAVAGTYTGTITHSVS